MAEVVNPGGGAHDMDSADHTGGSQGDIVYKGATDFALLSAGTIGEVLGTKGSSANPAWVNNDKALAIIMFESDTAVTTGNGKAGIPIASILNGWEIVDVIVAVHDKGITGTTNVMLRRRRAGSDVDMLATILTLGDEFQVSDGVLKTDGSEDIQTGDLLYFDVDTIHSGTAPNGMSVVATARAKT